MSSEPTDAGPLDAAVDVAPSGPQLAFVGTVTGKVHVVDLVTRTIRLTISASHSSIHGTAFMPDGRTLYTMDHQGSKVDKRSLALDLSDAPIVLSIPVKSPPTFLTRSPDARFLAVGTTESTMHGGKPPSVKGEEFATFIDTTSDTAVLALALKAPAEVLYNPSSTLAYPLQERSNQIPVVDLATLTVVDTWVVQEQTENDYTSGLGSVRQSDGLICVSNMEHHNVSCIDSRAPANQWTLPTEALIPHDMSFCDDLLWVQAAEHRPDPGHEEDAALIPSKIFVFDVDARVVVKELAQDFSVWHVRGGLDDRAYVSGSYGTLLVYDYEDYSLVATIPLQDGPQPLMSVDY